MRRLQLLHSGFLSPLLSSPSLLLLLLLLLAPQLLLLLLRCHAFIFKESSLNFSKKVLQVVIDGKAICFLPQDVLSYFAVDCQSRCCKIEISEQFPPPVMPPQLPPLALSGKCWYWISSKTHCSYWCTLTNAWLWFLWRVWKRWIIPEFFRVKLKKVKRSQSCHRSKSCPLQRRCLIAFFLGLL